MPRRFFCQSIGVGDQSKSKRPDIAPWVFGSSRAQDEPGLDGFSNGRPDIAPWTPGSRWAWFQRVFPGRCRSGMAQTQHKHRAQGRAGHQARGATSSSGRPALSRAATLGRQGNGAERRSGLKVQGARLRNRAWLSAPAGAAFAQGRRQQKGVGQRIDPSIGPCLKTIRPTHSRTGQCACMSSNAPWRPPHGSRQQSPAWAHLWRAASTGKWASPDQ